jgi:hypothetical protein
MEASGILRCANFSPTTTSVLGTIENVCVRSGFLMIIYPAYLMVLVLGDHMCGTPVHHDESAFNQCCRGGAKVAAAPPRDGPIIPSNCKTHLTCKPVHPPRNDIWSSWTSYAAEWFTTTALWITGGAVALGGCVYGYTVIQKARKKRRNARLREEGRLPPGEGDSDSDESDEDNLRGNRG